MSATLLQEHTSPEGLLATSQGNMQALTNGNVFVGWGSEPFIFEFSYDAKILFEAYLRFDGESYRAFRFPWSANLTEELAVAAERVPEDEVMFYASWNGVTEVATWEVLSGRRPDQPRGLESIPRDGFETPILVRTSDSYVAVQAKDRSGQILGTCAAVKL